jgi:hypothetical protein
MAAIDFPFFATFDALRFRGNLEIIVAVKNTISRKYFLYFPVNYRRIPAPAGSLNFPRRRLRIALYAIQEAV